MSKGNGWGRVAQKRTCLAPDGAGQQIAVVQKHTKHTLFRVFAVRFRGSTLCLQAGVSKKSSRKRSLIKCPIIRLGKLLCTGTEKGVGDKNSTAFVASNPTLTFLLKKVRHHLSEQTTVGSKHSYSLTTKIFWLSNERF